MGLVTELVEQSRPEPGMMGRIIDEITQVGAPGPTWSTSAEFSGCLPPGASVR
jgi:hypothetical protein